MASKAKCQGVGGPGPNAICDWSGGSVRLWGSLKRGLRKGFPALRLRNALQLLRASQLQSLYHALSRPSLPAMQTATKKNSIGDVLRTFHRLASRPLVRCTAACLTILIDIK